MLWVPYDDSRGLVGYRASAYTVLQSGRTGEWLAIGAPGTSLGRHNTVSEAKAACQAHADKGGQV
jgi:hypothetical protein